MNQDRIKLTKPQWEFLALYDAIGQPLKIETAQQLSPLPPGPFLDLFRQAEAGKWLIPVGPDAHSLSKTLPPVIKKKLRKINTAAVIAGLLKKVNQLKLTPVLGEKAVARLYHRSGRTLKAALHNEELARTHIEQKRFTPAMESLEKVVSLLTGIEDLDEAGHLYIKTALLLSSLRLRMGNKLGEVPQLLRHAWTIAENLGDRRSRALIDLHLGRFAYVSVNLADAVSSLGAGLDEAQELGDEDIIAQSAQFKGLYQFLQGNYKDAVKHLKAAMLTSLSRKEDLGDFFTPYVYGYCTAYLGRFDQAVGVLHFQLKRYENEKEHGLSAFFRSALGIVLLIMGKKESALYHIEKTKKVAQQHHSPQPLIMANLGLCYYYFLEGNIIKAAEMLFQQTNETAQTHFPPRQYTFPFILEHIYALKKAGYDVHRGPFYDDYQQEMDRVINGPNIHLRGVACRIEARDILNRNGETKIVLEALERSERYLKQSGDPVELAKTRAQIARVLLIKNQKHKARTLAHQAWPYLTAYNGLFFPSELMPMVKIDHHKILPDTKPTVLERFLGLMEALISDTDADNLLTGVVANSAEFFGAERGALFWFNQDNKNENAPELRAGHNLSEHMVSEPGFQDNMALVLKAYGTNQPLITPEKIAGRSRRFANTVLCLPFEVKNKVTGVFYYDKHFTDGRFDFLERHTLFRIARLMSAYIERILAYKRFKEQKSSSDPTQATRIDGTGNARILAQSPVMNRLLSKLDQVALSDASTLILGETGVGKELLALRIHAKSARANGPFVAVDLSTIPENLVESELFGHEKGAFTGADRQKPGRLDLAHQGTLFLDEIGEIPYHLQTKLLRAIQEKSFTRVGGTRVLSPDFRLVAATNRDLELEVAEGRFREDLFYRINVIPLSVPPLRERGKDILLLVRHFISHFSRKHNRPLIEVVPEDEEKLMSYSWPGNVRELKNVIERSVLLARENRLEISLPSPQKPSAKEPFLDMPTLDEMQKRYIRHVLKQTGGKMAGENGAADILGMKRTTLYTRMKKLGL